MQIEASSASSVRCGVDIVELDEFERLLDVGKHRFLARIFTERELTQRRGKLWDLAVGLAAKEAVSKALGTGIRRIRWHEIQILDAPENGVRLSGTAARIAARRGLTNWCVDSSCSRTSVIAVALAFECRAARTNCRAHR
jgi:holo-[acyl-carrier protein] synthase